MYIFQGLRSRFWRTAIVAGVLILLQILVLIGFGFLGAFQ
jgi:hypothetical protein